MKSARASQWCGVTAEDTVSLLATGAVYFAVLGALMIVLGEALRRVPPLYRNAAALLVAGGAVWAILSAHREQTPNLYDAFVAGMLLLIAGAHSLRPVPAGLAGWSFACGITGVFAAGERFLFDAERARYVSLIGVAWPFVIAMFLMAGAGLWGIEARKRNAALGALLFVAPLLAVFPPQWIGGEVRGPNLVFIVSDTLRAKDLKLYGGDVPAPNLEALAGRGTNFTRAYSLAPWTLPSMTGMFSSSYPSGLTPGLDQGAWNQQLWRYRVPENTRTLQQILGGAGYATGAVTGNALLWVTPGMTDGFDVLATSHPILLVRGGPFRAAPLLQAVVAKWLPSLAPLHAHDTTEALTRYAEAFVRRQRGPFYLWLHYIDPHAPYDPPARYRTKDGKWPLFYPFKGGEQWGNPILGKPDFGVPSEEREYVASLYRGEVRYVDEFVGHVTGMLKRRHMLDNTYVVFTSDHGEELWEHGDWGHGQSLKEELVHVPFIVSGPNVKAQSIAPPVSAIDLMPTLAVLLSQEPDPAWRGQSLARVLSGAEPPDPARIVFAQGTSNRAVPEPLQMAIKGNHKLVRRAGSGTVSLYDLAADPQEQHDIAAGNEGIVNELRGALLQWLGSFASTFPLDAQEQSNKRQLLESLKGLGYL